MLNLLGTAICLGGLRSIPDFKERLWQLKSPTAAVQTPTVAEIDTQIFQHRQQLESLQATFAQDGADLAKQFQVLDAQRKALKPADTAAITKFNEMAAAYQARNLHRKEMQEAMASDQKELDTMLDTRARTAVTNSRKVIMYTTSHCPACKAAKQYLAQKGVSYEEIDVEHSPSGAQAFQKLGGRGVPLILVGDKKMEGFSPQALDALL